MRRRMMKGDEEPEMVIGAIIFVMAISFVLLIVFMDLTKFSTVVATNQDTIAAISVAHRALACFGDGSPVVQGSKITYINLNSCNVGGYSVCVKDMEDPSRKWLDCGMSNPDHTIYLALKSGDTIHMGRLNVKKK